MLFTTFLVGPLIGKNKVRLWCCNLKSGQCQENAKVPLAMSTQIFFSFAVYSNKFSLRRVHVTNFLCAHWTLKLLRKTKRPRLESSTKVTFYWAKREFLLGKYLNGFDFKTSTADTPMFHPPLWHALIKAQLSFFNSSRLNWIISIGGI